MIEILHHVPLVGRLVDPGIPQRLAHCFDCIGPAFDPASTEALCPETVTAAPLVDHQRDQAIDVNVGVRGVVCLLPELRVRRLESGRRVIDPRTRADLTERARNETDGERDRNTEGSGGDGVPAEPVAIAFPACAGGVGAAPTSEP